MSDPLIPCPNCGNEILTDLNFISADCVSINGLIIKTPQVHCTNCSAEVGETLAKIVNHYLNLSLSVFPEGGISLVYFAANITSINKALDSLPASKGKVDLAQILRMRYGLGIAEPMTFKEIKEALGVSAQTVKNSEEKAIRHLRIPSRSRGILNNSLGRKANSKIYLIQENQRLRRLLKGRDEEINKIRRELESQKAFLGDLKTDTEDYIKGIDNYLKG